MRYLLVFLRDHLYIWLGGLDNKEEYSNSNLFAIILRSPAAKRTYLFPFLFTGSFKQKLGIYIAWHQIHITLVYYLQTLIGFEWQNYLQNSKQEVISSGPSEI